MVGWRKSCRVKYESKMNIFTAQVFNTDLILGIDSNRKVYSQTPLSNGDDTVRMMQTMRKVLPTFFRMMHG